MISELLFSTLQQTALYSVYTKHIICTVVNISMLQSSLDQISYVCFSADCFISHSICLVKSTLYSAFNWLSFASNQRFISETTAIVHMCVVCTMLTRCEQWNKFSDLSAIRIVYYLLWNFRSLHHRTKFHFILSCSTSFARFVRSLS